MEYLAGASVTIVIVLASLIFVGNVLNLRHEERKLKLKAEADRAAGGAVAGEMLAELAKVKDRVAVLERLITDEDRRVAGEISRLGASADARA